MSTHDLTQIDLRHSYDSSETKGDLVDDFFTPVLSSSMTYWRLSGYFNSGMLAACARGMSSFLLEGGEMKLVCSPKLSEVDLLRLQNPELSANGRNLIFENSLNREVQNIGLLEDLLERDHVEAMAWLLDSGRLRIKLAIGQESELFHQKRGIVFDALGNSLSFSGSINETHAGWSSNIEEFKVFRSWESGEKDYLEEDVNKFLSFWKQNPDTGLKIIELPDAIREGLCEYAPKDISRIDLKRNRKRRTLIEEDAADSKHPLRNYQRAAVDTWFGNDCMGIMVMATGAGKTLIAATAIEEYIEKNPHSLVVVTAPYQHIAMQWSKELSTLNPLALWKEPDWRKSLRKSLSELRAKLLPSKIVITVQNTAASPDFLEMLEDERLKVAKLLVGDEAHALGAQKMSASLSESYDGRLGLTATPTRYFDEDGSDRLSEFFGGPIAEFTIEDALSYLDESGRTVLAPYQYHPVFFDLSDEELEVYARLTQRIIIAKAGEDSDSRSLNWLYNQRAAVIKNASGKIAAVESILKQLPELKRLVVYCANENQLTDVAEILSSMSVLYRRFSGKESSKPDPAYGGISEREKILEDFTSGHIDVLLAMKCLDEGVNIPTAETGILVASSGNPKEFIQRRGRLLRQSPKTGKQRAEIFDLVPRPPQVQGGKISREFAGILRRELARVKEFAGPSLNSSSVEFAIDKLMEEHGLFDIGGVNHEKAEGWR